MSKKDLTQLMRVAKFVHQMGVDMGADYTTGNDKLATSMAEALATMTAIENPSRVDDMVEAFIKARGHVAPDIEIWTYMSMFTNWLSWAWHEEGFDDLSMAWADAWRKINVWSLDHLKDEELSYYINKTD
jgi:hypothetical protein